MSQTANVVIHLRDLEGVEGTDALREHLQQRCHALAVDFPETHHYELTISSNATAFDGSAVVGGKQTQLAAHSHGLPNIEQAGDRLLDKIERELRKEHDKRIFNERRRVQKERSNRAE